MAEDSPDVTAIFKLAKKRFELQQKFEEGGYSADAAKVMANEYLPLRRIDATAAGSVRAAAQPDTAATDLANANEELQNLLKRNVGEAARGPGLRANGESDSKKKSARAHDPIVDLSLSFWCNKDVVDLAHKLDVGDDEKIGLDGRSAPRKYCAVQLPGFYSSTALLSAVKEHDTFFSLLEHVLATYGMTVKENVTLGSVCLSDITPGHMGALIRCIFA